MTRRIKPKVISEHSKESKTIFATHDHNDSLVKDIELETYTCGSCEFVLAENIVHNAYNDIVFVFPSCQSYNESANQTKKLR